VVVGAACDCGCESSCSCGHIHSQGQNAQSLHTQALGLAPVAGLGAEAARHGDPAHSHSYNHSHRQGHSHSLGHSQDHNTVNDNLLPWGTCDQNGACARAPPAMLAAAHSTDLGHERLDLHTMSHHWACTGAHVCKCHRESVRWGHCRDDYKMTMIWRYNKVGIQRAVWLDTM